MKEVLIPYILICVMLIKFEYVRYNPKNLVIMAMIGASILFFLILGSRYYAIFDMTKSTVVRTHQILLNTPAGGDIDKVYVTHNQRVKAGEPIFSYSIERYEIQKKALIAELERQQTLLTNDTKTYNRMKNLRGEMLSETEVDNQYAKMLASKALVVQAQSKIDDLDWKIRHAVVKAPEDGVMAIVYIAEGQYFGESRPSALILFTDRKFVEMRIPEQSYPFIQEGAFAEFFLNAYPGRIFRGRVQSVGQTTGEAQASFLAAMPQYTSTNLKRFSPNFGRIVIIDFKEPPGVYVPVGANGQGWIMGTKSSGILGMFDLLAGVVLRLVSVEAYLFAW